MSESSAQKEIEKRMEAIEEGSPRWDVLNIARRFKTTWVDLGSKLWDVRQKKLYESWGYEKFDDYCAHEIRIKPKTAAKLTASFWFLKKEEPAVLKRDGVTKPVPDVQIVDMLRNVKEKEEVPEKEYDRIKELAFKENAPITTLRKEIKPYLAPKELPSADKLIKQFISQASRLAEGLAAAAGIPQGVVERALALVDDIKELVKK
jgi:hypothetical protein